MSDDDDRDFFGNVIFIRSEDLQLESFRGLDTDAVFTYKSGDLIHFQTKVFAGSPESFASEPRLISTDWTPDVSAKKKATGEEQHLQAALSEEDADAVLGDLAEMYERDTVALSPKVAAKLRRYRARQVRASLPGFFWPSLLRSFFRGLEMQSYWWFAVVLYLIYCFVHS